MIPDMHLRTSRCWEAPSQSPKSAMSSRQCQPQRKREGDCRGREGSESRVAINDAETKKERASLLKWSGAYFGVLCIWAESKTHINKTWASAILLTKDVHIWPMVHILNNQQTKKCFASEITKLGHDIPSRCCLRQPCLITALKHAFFVPSPVPLYWFLWREQ